MKKYLCLLVLVVACSTLWAKSDVKLQQVRGGYVYDFVMPQWTTVSVNDLGASYEAGNRTARYSKLVVPAFEGYYSEDIGNPELALSNFKMVIADKNNLPVFEVSDVVEEVSTLASPLFPAQMEWPKSLPIEDRPFKINSEYYASHGVRSPMVKVVDVTEIRGVTFATVNITPFSYDPLTKALRVVTKARITVKTDIKKSAAIDSKSFEDMLDLLTVNYYDYYEPRSIIAKDNYLIICADKYEAGLAAFKTFREKKYNVSLVKYSTAGGSKEKVVAYINTLYGNATTKPTHVLLVGSHGDIPGFSFSAPTDRPYSSLSTSTFTPKVHVGRWAVTSDADLANCIKKTMFMEKGLGDKTVPRTAVFIGGVDATWFATAEGTHNYCINTYLLKTIPPFVVTKLYAGSNSALRKTDWTAAMNKGMVYNFYSAHGAVTSWAVGGSFGSITITDFKALTNTTSFPHSGAFACYTGNYQSNGVSPLAVNLPVGPVTCVASSITSTWGPDDKFQRIMFDGMYKNNLVEKPKDVQMGTVYDAGAVGSATSVYLQQYNFFGDPGMSANHYYDNVAIESNTLKSTGGDIAIHGIVNNQISFSIAKAGNYDIAMFSVAGQKIFSLKQSFSKAGNYSIPYAHKNLAKGLYVVTLQNGAQKAMKKITH